MPTLMTRDLFALPRCFVRDVKTSQGDLAKMSSPENRLIRPAEPWGGTDSRQQAQFVSGISSADAVQTFLTSSGDEGCAEENDCK